MSYKILMLRLELQRCGVCVVFTFISTIISIMSLNCQFVPSASPQHVAPHRVVGFNVDLIIFRFLVTNGSGVVCSDFITTV